MQSLVALLLPVFALVFTSMFVLPAALGLLLAGLVEWPLVVLLVFVCLALPSVASSCLSALVLWSHLPHSYVPTAVPLEYLPRDPLFR